MKPYLGQRGLFKLFALTFCIVIFLPIIIIGSLSYLRSSDYLKIQTEEYLGQIVLNVSNQMDTIIRDYDWLSLRIISSREVRQITTAESYTDYDSYLFQNWASNSFINDIFMQKSYIRWFSIYGSNGYVYTTDSGKNHKEIENLQQALPTNGSIKLFVIRGAAGDSSAINSNQFFVFLGRSLVYNANKTSGTFFMEIGTQQFGSIWKQVDLKGGQIWITDQNGQFIYHPESKYLGRNVGETMDMLSLNQDSGAFTCKINGTEQFVVYRTSGYTGWKTITAVPLKELNKPVNNLRNAILLSALFAFPLAIFIGYVFIVFIIIKPIRKIQHVMKEVGKGNWVKIEGNLPRNEIGDLIQGYNVMVGKVSELIETVYEAELRHQKEELAQKKAELQALQTQINPHFLYNTLGAINTYALTDKKQPVKEMIDALGNMFRYAVQNPLEPVKVKDEILHVENYLLIQNYRQRNMPKIEWNLAKYAEYPMLRLTLQPLIENIFNHAFPNGIEFQHTIWIEAKEKNGSFVIEVSDNGVGPEWDIPEFEFIANERGGKGGIGLSNVHRRLKLAYGNEYGIKISGKKGIGMTVIMLMPLPSMSDGDVETQ